MVSQTHENFELPSPQPTEGLDQVGDTIEARPASSPENSPSTNTGPTGSSMQPTKGTPLPVQPLDDPLALVSVPAANLSGSHKVDGIEKVWIEKAKQVIKQTKDDPRVQKTEISKVKSGYMKAAYSKDVKLQE